MRALDSAGALRVFMEREETRGENTCSSLLYITEVVKEEVKEELEEDDDDDKDEDEDEDEEQDEDEDERKKKLDEEDYEKRTRGTARRRRLFRVP